MSHVDLGIAEECESKWLTNVYFPSKLGGKPAWLDLDELPTRESLDCKKCNNQKSFLCQIYAPFDDKFNFHRMIYVFLCRSESCNIANQNGNITILRSQIPRENQFYSAEAPPEEGDAMPEVFPNKKLCEACGCLGPFKCGRCKKISYCGAHHQRLHWPYHKILCSNDESMVTKSKDLVMEDILFPEWEIDINAEQDDNVKERSTIVLNEEDELKTFEKLRSLGKIGTFPNLPDSELEKYADINVIDKSFQKFRKECAKEPLQIIRYTRNGEVLWISDIEKTVKGQLENIPKCELCNEDRVFEFQIMPQMLNYLKDSIVDWGVIAVYTCPKSCPLPKEKGYVEEFCIKQDINK